MLIKSNFNLQDSNTFGIPCIAKTFIRFDSESDLHTLLDHIDEPIFVLGGGSNMLLVKEQIPLVLNNDVKGISLIKEEEDYVLIECGAGEEWHDVVLWAIAENYGGIENLSLIPGSVGASPIQNIGAYGVELKDVFESLLAIHIEKNVQINFHNNECQFGYRNSIFKNELKDKLIITRVVLKLSKPGHHKINTSYGAIETQLGKMGVAKEPSLKQISDAVITIRSSKLPDPKVIGNSGSFFKNPLIPNSQFETLKRAHENIPGYSTENGTTKVPAAWLLDQCGWKGKVVGNTGCYKHQPLVVVNHGAATGKEILDFTKQLQKSVNDKFGISLQAEVNVFS